MLHEAKLLGASAALLICAILDEGQVRDYIDVCDALGLSALVEAHDEAEVEMALKAGARIIGVNNRNLKDFTVDTGNSRRLRAMIPRDVRIHGPDRPRRGIRFAGGAGGIHAPEKDRADTKGHQPTGAHRSF